MASTNDPSPSSAFSGGSVRTTRRGVQSARTRPWYSISWMAMSLVGAEQASSPPSSRRVQLSPAFGQAAVDRRARAAGEQSDLAVGVATGMQQQVAALARLEL